MAKFFLFVLTFFVTGVFGQTPIKKTSEIVPNSNNSLEKDSSIMVAIVVGAGSISRTTAYFLNGQFVTYGLLVSMNPKLIDDLKVVYEDIEIDSIKYHKQVRFKSKSNYFPKAISLTALMSKYANLKNIMAIITIDGSLINGDYDTYKIDENNLSSITIDHVKNLKEKNIVYLRLLTKSEENIKAFKYGGIWLKGAGMWFTK